MFIDHCLRVRLLLHMVCVLLGVWFMVRVFRGLDLGGGFYGFGFIDYCLVFTVLCLVFRAY